MRRAAPFLMRRRQALRRRRIRRPRTTAPGPSAGPEALQAPARRQRTRRRRGAAAGPAGRRSARTGGQQQRHQAAAIALAGDRIDAHHHGKQCPQRGGDAGHVVHDLGIVEQAELGAADQHQAERRHRDRNRQQPGLAAQRERQLARLLGHHGHPVRQRGRWPRACKLQAVARAACEVRGEFGDRAFRHGAAGHQNIHPRAAPFHIVEQVRAQQYRRAVLRQRRQQVMHLAPAARIEAVRRLVQHQQLGHAHQGTRDAQALAQAAREGADRLARPRRLGDGRALASLSPSAPHRLGAPARLTLARTGGRAERWARPGTPRRDVAFIAESDML
jgi:hypothetical protein